MNVFNFTSRNKIIPQVISCEPVVSNVIKEPTVINFVIKESPVINFVKKSKIVCEKYSNINLKIRNMMVLSESELSFIETLSHEELTELINIYNNIVNTINSLYLDNTVKMDDTL